MNHITSTPDHSISALSVDVQDQLCRSKAGLRALAALLECYGEHGTSGDGYIDQPNLMCGLMSLLNVTVDCLDLQSEALGTIEAALRDFEGNPPLGSVVTAGHHQERLRANQ